MACINSNDGLKVFSKVIRYSPCLAHKCNSTQVVSEKLLDNSWILLITAVIKQNDSA